MDTIAPVELVERYRALRDKVKEIKERHSIELEPYTAAMDRLEAAALQQMQALGAESISTGAGTMYRTMRQSYAVSDGGAFRAFVRANDRDDMLETRVAKSVVEAYVVETGATPPGVTLKVDVAVNFRK